MQTQSAPCARHRARVANSRLFLVLCHAIGATAVLAEHMPLLRGGNSPSMAGPRAKREAQLANQRHETELQHSGVHCPTGRYWNSQNGGRLVSCDFCPPGRFKEVQGDRRPCTVCPMGKYQHAKGSTTCEWCLAGQFANRFGMSKCAPCPQGKFLPWQWHFRIVRSYCIMCEPGKTSTSDRKSCHRPSYLKAKPTTTTLAPQVATTAAPASLPPGTILGGTSAPIAGHLAPGQPTPFPTPMNVNVKPTKPKIHCDSGWFRVNHGLACQKCPMGKYQPELDKQECHACPKDMFSEQQGSTCYRIVHAFAKADCGPGTYYLLKASKLKMHMWHLVCRTCPPGTFQKQRGMAQCRQCPVGKYTSGYELREGAHDQCVECPAGKYQRARGQHTCHLCPKGKYQPYLNRFHAHVSCHSCPEGRVASKDRKKCIMSHNSYLENGYLCKAGRYFVGGTEADQTCALCPPGRFQPKTGQRDCDECSQGHVASHDHTACKVATTTTLSPNAPCPRGRFGAPPQMPCKQCPQGKYQANEGVHECWDCPVGKVANDDRYDCHVVTRVWKVHHGAYGARREHPAPSCQSILMAAPHAVDGYYWIILPSGRTINAFCLMSEGGWMQLASSKREIVDGAHYRTTEWQELLSSDYFALPSTSAILSSPGPRQDGFPNLNDFDFSAPLRTFDSVPFREVLLFDGKSYHLQTTKGQSITTLREIIDSGGFKRLYEHESGKPSGFVHLQGHAGQSMCFYPKPDGSGCALPGTSDSGEHVTSFHVANLAACTAHPQSNDVISYLWGRDNCYGKDEGGGYGGFTWHRKVNKKPWVDGGFQGKGWAVYVRDQQIPPLHKSTVAGLRKYYGRACGDWCSSASDPRRPHDPYHVFEREQSAN